MTFSDQRTVNFGWKYCRQWWSEGDL